MGYQCTNGDGNAGTLLVSNLDNGETYAVCGPCIPGWAKALSDMFPVEPQAEVSAECPVCGDTVPLSEAENHWATKHGSTEPGPDDPTDDDEPRAVPDFPAPAGPTSAESSPGGQPGGDTPDGQNGQPEVVNLPPGDSADVPHVGGLSTNVDEPEDNGRADAPPPVAESAPI